jgi:hypothetical protein
MHSLNLWLGSEIDLIAPDVNQIYADDIAVALSRICRFGGHTVDFYSVAQHSVFVSRYCGEHGGPAAARWGLLHDASEAYLGDIVWPLKHVPEMRAAYAPIEERMMEAIARRFALGPKPAAIVHDGDRAVLLAEARDLHRSGRLLGRVAASRVEAEIDQIKPWPAEPILALEPHRAARLFRTEFEKLWKGAS